MQYGCVNTFFWLAEYENKKVAIQAKNLPHHSHKVNEIFLPITYAIFDQEILCVKTQTRYITRHRTAKLQLATLEVPVPVRIVKRLFPNTVILERVACLGNLSLPWMCIWLQESAGLHIVIQHKVE